MSQWGEIGFEGNSLFYASSGVFASMVFNFYTTIKFIKSLKYLVKTRVNKIQIAH